MECHRKRHQRTLGNTGQSTLEYALVTAAVLAVALCFEAVFEMASDGVLAERVVAALPRSLPMGLPDILAF